MRSDCVQGFSEGQGGHMASFVEVLLWNLNITSSFAKKPEVMFFKSSGDPTRRSEGQRAHV